MKRRLLTLFAVLLITDMVNAQAPFTTYKPVILPERSYSVPNFSFPDPLDELMSDYAAEAAARARANEIVSSNVITADGLNIYNSSYSPLKVKIIRRRNGLVEYNCLGIKKNGNWSVCEKEIISLEAAYKNASSQSDKTAILELMEYGNFLLVVNPDKEVYIIK